MKNFQTQIIHVCNDNLPPVTTCINWKLIVDVNFGTKHLCETMGANLVNLNLWHFYAILTYLDLASLGLQKCFAPKSTSTISFQLIYMVNGAELSLQICII